MKFDKYKKQFARVIFLDPADYDNRFDKDFEPIKCCTIGWQTKKITIQYLGTNVKFQTGDDKNE